MLLPNCVEKANKCQFIHEIRLEIVQRGHRPIEFKTGFDCLRWLCNDAAPQLNGLLTLI